MKTICNALMQICFIGLLPIFLIVGTIIGFFQGLYVWSANMIDTKHWIKSEVICTFAKARKEMVKFFDNKVEGGT